MANEKKIEKNANENDTNIKTVKKKRKKIRWVGLIIVILFVYIIVTITYSILTNPIKQINIEGNYYLKDNYLIDYLDIDGKSIIGVSRSKIKNKLLELDLISDVKVSKNYLGTLNIVVVEDNILFYNWNSEKIVLSSGKEIDNYKDYFGIPNLINYVPENVYKSLIKKLSKVDMDILHLVSEIEYSPSIVNNKTIDEKRFIFRMNDGNIVYINTTNMDKLDDYLDLYEAVVNKNGEIKGCFYLDSNSNNIEFNNCESPKESDEDDDKEEGDPKKAED